MFELYFCKLPVSDCYMGIIDNPDRDLPGHKPYYDISLTPDGGIAHGEQWSEQEHTDLHKRQGKKFSTFQRIDITEAPAPVQLAILQELQAGD